MTTTQQSVLYTVLFHGLALLLMYLIKFNLPLSMPPLDYYEFITFETLPIPLDRRVSSQSGGEQSDQNQPMVPPAQQLDIPQINNPDYVPFDFSDLPDKSDQNRLGNLYQSSYQDDLQPTQNTLTPTNSSTDSNSSNNPSMGLDGLGDAINSQTGTKTAYEMQGDAVNRVIISKPLPAFPNNIDRNGSVTMQFTVLPDGSVADVIVTRKSEPEFETVSVNALKQWVFNRADRSHTGQITFNFRRE